MHLDVNYIERILQIGAAKFNFIIYQIYNLSDLSKINFKKLKGKPSSVDIPSHLWCNDHTISRIYKDRWQIETFFKTIKQNLKIKTCVGTQPERPDDSDLDSIDGYSRVEVPKVTICTRMVITESDRDATIQSLYLKL